MSFLNPNPQAFGLDINEYSLKMAQLTKVGKKINLKSWNSLPLPKGVIVNGEIRDENEFIFLVQKLLKNRKGHGHLGREVVAVLPEEKTFLKSIIIKQPAEENLEKIVLAEAEKQLPYKIDEVYLDWQITGGFGDSMLNILIGAAPKKTVDSYLTALQKCSLEPIALEIEAQALCRALLKPDLDEKKSAKIIIDFGATRSGLVIYDKGLIQSTISLPISGNQITQTIIEKLGLDWDQAEKAKIICGLDQSKCSGALLEILEENLDALANRINQAIGFYTDRFIEPSPIDEIILCGGSANFFDIGKIISERTKIKTTLGNPWTNLISADHLPLPANQSLSLTTVIGLAIRGLNSEYQ